MLCVVGVPLALCYCCVDVVLLHCVVAVLSRCCAFVVLCCDVFHSVALRCVVLCYVLSSWFVLC